jgi:ketosteroid isomerase-like protein
MTMSTREREVFEVEKKFWDAMKAKDARSARELTDDRCIVVGAQGVASIDGETMGTLTTDGAWQLERYSFDEDQAQIRFIGDDVAIVAYRVDERLVVDGETVPLAANDSSVWVRRDGQWKCALHTESIAGDPYGRDRIDADNGESGARA